MRPKELAMQAFGSYGKKTRIDFTQTNQNLFLIAGNTGAGKTTIFDAMVFALYGEASSESNRKDGRELQSQFEDFTVEPFVELSFSEREGGEERVYQVRRVPRHLRPIVKGKNKGGFRECQETVSLFLPDGTEYSQNKGETDRKLEEIVGLTKGQFMQVGMIAQGEFMELLRARSEDKKIIFRKLFHTELFQQVVEELARRRKEMEAGIEQVQLDCKKEAGRVRIPEEYEGGGLAAIQKSILTPGKLNITQMEQFMEGLEELCGKLEEENAAAQKEYEGLSRRRDELLKACTRAQQLMRSFGELQKAEAELAECKGREGEMEEARLLLSRIRDAYEIQSFHQRYQDARKNQEEREKNLKAQRERLPLLMEQEKTSAKKEEGAKNALEKEQAAFSKTEERVGKALERLKELRGVREQEKWGKSLLAGKESAVKAAQKELEDFEEKERENRRQADALGDVGAASAQLEARQREAYGIAEDMARVKKVQEDVCERGRHARKSLADYEKASKEYMGQHELFLEKQRAFLDAQAGLLAREKLRPGAPCPVCGSLEHPSPCQLSQEHRELTREVIEALAKEDERLNREQSRRSEEAKKARTAYEEKEQTFREAAENLRKRMEGSWGKLPEKMTLKQAEEGLDRWQGKLQEEKASLEQKRKTLKEAQAFLKNADEKKQSLRKALEQLSEQMMKARSDHAAVKARAEQLAGQQDYPTEEAARGALKEVAGAREKAEMLHQEAQKAARKARSDREGAETLIQRYERELPELQRETKERKNACDAIEKEKGLTEEQWQEIIGQYRKEEVEEIRSRLEEYTRRKSVAEGAQKAAREAIGEQEKPDIEEMEKTSREVEARWKEAKDRLEERKDLFKNNDAVRRALKPQMEERGRMVRDFSRLDGLHGRLAGKVSGARMDIETFVQRYYLEQVLQAANERFMRMSAGQFELRMTGEEQAGAGKNRGLDLMVYSTVTGKEREIRTLSGGESFMAALSLALGMADQIQEKSAAIHLDVMFIDEGFGSLDDHSRNQAVKVLQQVAGGSRLIGIISHVSELRQEIENQLLVSKDEEGSHVKWVIS